MLLVVRRASYGIIPARAGSSYCAKNSIKLVVGSSPRARGAASESETSYDILGIIPARAGSSLVIMKLLAGLGDHPRARGEQIWLGFPFDVFQGSSPRARGAVIRILALDHPVGIIPARAGSRQRFVKVSVCPQDHPRARGEQRACRLAGSLLSGSSPRAGSSTGVATPSHQSRDHPRARGEQGGGSRKIQSCLGSSPRARGAERHRRGEPPRQGIIPARAGSR